jgi:hypothetical protein
MQWKARVEGVKAWKFFFKLSHRHSSLDPTTEPCLQTKIKTIGHQEMWNLSYFESVYNIDEWCFLWMRQLQQDALQRLHGHPLDATKLIIPSNNPFAQHIEFRANKRYFLWVASGETSVLLPRMQKSSLYFVRVLRWIARQSFYCKHWVMHRRMWTKITRTFQGNPRKININLEANWSCWEKD